MSEKVKVSKRFHESAKVRMGSDLLFDIPYIQRVATGEYPDTEWAKPLYGFYLDDKYKYFKALIDGYVVEATPEDKIRDLWDLATDIEKNAIRSTVNALGYKIEGVNT